MHARFLLLFFLTIIFLFSCQHVQQSETINLLPPPTGDIPIYAEHTEGEGKGDRRRAWLNMIHRTAPGTDWKKMDREFRNENAGKRFTGLSRTQESFAGGVIEGEWLERGSINQAGNLEAIEYKQSSDEIYAISGGGTLWKSKSDGSTWQSLNDDLQFHPKILAMIDESSIHRILTCQGKHVYYSDTDGATWHKSNGINFSSEWGLPIDLQITSTGDIYYLTFTWDNISGTSEMWLYYSNNNGNSFSKIKEFVHGQHYWDARNYTRMWVSKRVDTAYIVHLGSQVYSLTNGSLNPVLGVTGLPLAKAIDIEGSIENNGLKNLYVLSEHKDIYQSQDGGQNWSSYSNTNSDTWDVGLRKEQVGPESTRGLRIMQILINCMQILWTLNFFNKLMEQILYLFPIMVVCTDHLMMESVLKISVKRD